MLRNVNPSCYVRARIAHNTYDGQTVLCPCFEMGFVRINVETTSTDIGRAGLDLNEDKIATRLAVVSKQLDGTIDAKVDLFEGTEDGPHLGGDLAHQGDAFIASLGGLHILRSHSWFLLWLVPSRWGGVNPICRMPPRASSSSVSCHPRQAGQAGAPRAPDRLRQSQQRLEEAEASGRPGCPARRFSTRSEWNAASGAPRPALW